MRELVQGETNSKANPQVVFAWQASNVGDALESGVPAELRSVKGGFFQPLTSLSFRILRPDSTELISSTVVDTALAANQLDPTSEGGKGRIFVLPFTVGGAEPTGTYTAEVTFVADPEDGGPLDPRTETFTFRVLDSNQGRVDGAYAQIQDLLDEGFPLAAVAPTGGYSFATAARALRLATQYVEEITSRFFEPRYRLYDMNGKGGPAIQTRHSIIGLTKVSFTFTTFTPADIPIEEGDLRVYNRHIRQQLLEPDDRQNPRVEFLRSPVERFPRGQLLGDTDLLSSNVGFVDSQQNVQMGGMWGYTDPDGSPFGKTPDLIREVTMRLVARNIQPLWQRVGGAGASTGIAGPITGERTLDQGVNYANVAGSSAGGAGAYAGAFTGDPEIDQMLALFMAPPVFGSA